MALNPQELQQVVDATTAPATDEQVPGWAEAPMTRCDTCGVTDNHPTKVVVVQFGVPEQDIPDVVERHHHDCHAVATGDPHSIAVVEQSGGLKGHELRVFLHGDPDQGTEPQFVDPTSTSTTDQGA